MIKYRPKNRCNHFKILYYLLNTVIKKEERMRTLIAFFTKNRVSLLVLFFVLWLCRPGFSQQSEYERLVLEAEQLYAEGSYALAHKIYLSLDELAQCN